MGCKSFTIRGTRLRPDPYDGDSGCLCGYHPSHGIGDVAELRALASFGAAVLGVLYDGGSEGDELSVPSALSDQFRTDLDRLVPYTGS